MSAKTGAAPGFWARAFEHPQDLRAIRYAVGSTIAMGIAMGYQWDLSFLVPVLSLSFLANPAMRPGFKQGAVFVAAIGIACYVGLLLGSRLTPYPLVYLPFSALVLFHIFYAQQGGRSPLLITWLLIAVLVVPLLSLQADVLAKFVAAGLVFGAAVTIAVVWLVYFLIPEPEDFDEAAPPPPPAKPIPPPMERFKNAALSTAVVFPLMMVFFMFDMTGSILILVFVAMLSQQPAFAKSFKVGLPLIIGNAVGGAIAIGFYELLVMVPEFAFLLMLTLLAGLLFGQKVFSGKKQAPLFGMAFSTLLLIIGSVTSSDDAAGSKVYTRVFQIVVAVVYVVLAFGFIDRFLAERKARKERRA